MASLEKIKLTAQTWDSDKDIDSFHSWLDTFRSLVSSTDGGQPIEDFITYKTGLEVFETNNVPTFIKNDPDFAMYYDPRDSYASESGDLQEGSEPESGTMIPTTPMEIRRQRLIASAGPKKMLFTDTDIKPVSHTALPPRTLAAAPITYMQLPEKSRELDALLFNVFKMVVKGSKAGIITCVMFPSYIQAVCVLVEHMNISKYDRITRSIFALDQLSYQGDVHKFQVAAMDAIREVRATRANITHLILTRLMKAFEGKSKTVQYKIADIINSGESIDESLNLFDIIQSICSDIATVGDVKSTVNSVMDDIKCDYCGFKHRTEDCRKLMQAKAQKAAGRISSIPNKAPKGFSGVCDLCGEMGHKYLQCPKRKSKAVNAATIRAPVDETVEIPGAIVSNVSNRQPLSQAQLQLIMQKIQSGEATVSVTKPRTRQAARPTSGKLPPRKARKLTSRDGHDRSRDTAYGLRGDAHIGEASHPGPIEEAIVLALCSGMSTGLLALSLVQAKFTRFIAVEHNDVAKVVAGNLNRDCSVKPDHSWASDIFDISEQKVKDLGRGNVKQLQISAPCKDHSKLRLIPRGRSKKELTRPGFSGKHGKVFRMCLTIATWVLLYNADCEVFCENVDFSDMTADWKEVLKALGVLPRIVTADCCSFTRRRRAYWTSIPVPDDFLNDCVPRDPDSCMDEGRTVSKYSAWGKECVYPIGASWIGPHDNPRANTARPLLVNGHLSLRPHEAERLMGFEANSTAGNQVTWKQRLQCIGEGWDLNVVLLFFRHSQLVQPGYVECIPQTVLMCLSREDWELQQGLVALASQQGTAAVAGALARYSRFEQEHMIALMRHAGSGGGNSVLSQQSLVDSVLDSGSSRHIHPQAVVTDAEATVALTGFDHSTQWTQGGGYLPVEWTSRESGNTVSYDVEDVDVLARVTQPILSMGKLVRKGFDFFIGDYGKDMYAAAPGGAYTVKLELGIDDVVRIPHTLRSGKRGTKLPGAVSLGIQEAKIVDTQHSSALSVSRTAKDLNGNMLHQMLNHCGEEKMYQTLLHTTGFKPIRFNLPPCIWCALGKSTRTGTNRQRHTDNCISDLKGPGVNLALGTEGDLHSRAVNTYSDSDEGDCPEEADTHEEFQYEAAVAGRALGEQPVPRYDLSKLRPFEVTFADNKEYPCAIRGGKTYAFVMIDYYSQAKFKIDVASKSQNGKAFQRIMAINGIHKLPYHCHIWTDGCGSMNHVRDAAVLAGLDHAFLPPREPSLNEAEKVCNFMWAAARAHLATSKTSSALFAEAVDYAIYTDMRVATTASRGWKTPYELIKGVVPCISRMHRWYTRCYVNVPVSKRKYLEKQGVIDRAETGRLIGYHSLFSSTYKVLLSKNRVVHSRSVTFFDEDYTELAPIERRQVKLGQIPIPRAPISQSAEGAAAESMSEGVVEGGGNADEAGSGNWTQGLPKGAVNIESCDLFDLHQRAEREELQPEYFEWTPGGDKDKWLTHGDTAGSFSPRHRQAPDRLTFLCNVVQAYEEQGNEKEARRSVAVATAEYVQSSHNVDHEGVNLVCLFLAMSAHKDMSWSEVLKSDDREFAIRALQAEKDSLLSTILIAVDESHPEYESARALAVSGRYILDFKRVGVWKARGVKQGFKEDKLTADGPGFVYYAHVAKLVSVRMLLSRPGRGNRRLAIKDVRVAFLQSDKFPDDVIKYISFKDPVTKAVEYFRQTGPVYGEAGAPVRWENTIAPWLIEEGFERGCNEPAVYYHSKMDVLLLTYVDDLLYDGEEDDISHCDERLEHRFDCKDTEWLTPDMTPLDYLGMELLQSSSHLYLSMEAYICKTINLLQLDELALKEPPATPINVTIDTESGMLSADDRSWFMTAVGCLGWLVETGRPDVALAHSRVSQHMSKPNTSAMNTVVRIFLYLYGARSWVLSCETQPEQVDLTYHCAVKKETWEFYVDSDFAGNAEVQNRRRSQIGIVAVQNGFPVLWSSKVSSVAFADEAIGEAHPDTSSGAAEVYAAGNCTYDFLFLAHVASEMALDFPRPFKIQMDNSAAECFAKGTAFKSKLKHIDCRQEWVKVLRDRDICTPVHVDSKDNLADMFTKILPETDFIRLRSKLMVDMRSVED